MIKPRHFLNNAEIERYQARKTARVIQIVEDARKSSHRISLVEYDRPGEGIVTTFFEQTNADEFCIIDGYNMTFDDELVRKLCDYETKNKKVIMLSLPGSSLRGIRQRSEEIRTNSVTYYF